MPKLLVLVLLGGCAAPAANLRPVAPVHAVVREDAASAAQRDRIRELQALLGLAQAEAEDLRAEVRTLRAEARSRTTQISTPPACDDEGTWTDDGREETSSRPVLRLYGPPPSEPVAPMPPIAAPPPGLRLPVAMGPGYDPSLGVPPIPATPIEIAPPAPMPAPREDTGGAVYRAALAHLAQRRFDEALAGLDAFLRDHPRHPYADNALYWRGEIHYARRDYRRAIAELSALVERYPRGNKVPEALLRIALSYEHMGDAVRARQVLERLRREHPNSVAAQAAEREDV